MPTATEMKTCSDCETMLTIWWIDEDAKDDKIYCAGCFVHTGASCGGCAHDECRQCADEEDEEEHEFVGDYVCYCMECGEVIKDMTEKEFVMDDEVKLCAACKESEEADEQTGGCVYCHSADVYAHCDLCESRGSGDGGAMCRSCFYEKGHEEDEPHARWCGGCWREECEAFAEEFPNAKCAGCSTALDREARRLCGGQGGACETWYCADCHEEGTHDCSVCSSK
jgi:hypothetical protein